MTDRDPTGNDGMAKILGSWSGMKKYLEKDIKKVMVFFIMLGI